MRLKFIVITNSNPSLSKQILKVFNNLIRNHHDLITETEAFAKKMEGRVSLKNSEDVFRPLEEDNLQIVTKSTKSDLKSDPKLYRTYKLFIIYIKAELQLPSSEVPEFLGLRRVAVPPLEAFEYNEPKGKESKRGYSLLWD